MARLSLTLLGAPEVRHGGRPLLLPTRKTLAILVFLAVEGGRHTRDKLAALFWPDSDEVRGRASLRRALSSIHQATNDIEHAPSSRHLSFEQNLVGIGDASDLYIDLRMVETALETVTSPSSIRNGGRNEIKTADVEYREMLEQIERAATIARGEFLEGFSLNNVPAFDDWLSLQREVWHRKVGLLLERLSHLQTEVGEIAKAAATARIRVAHNPFNEGAYRDLIRLLLASGDRKGAELAYENLRSMLSAEWGADPSPETQALMVGTVDDPAAAIDPHGSRGPRRSPTAPQPSALLERYMVGRATQFRELIGSFYRADGGQPQSVVIMGETGIGKTRLATEFLGWASAHGANVLAGRAFEMSGRLPYQSVTEAIRTGLERHNSPDDLLSDVWLAELGKLMPELLERYPDLPGPRKHEAVTKTRLFEAVSRLLQALAARQPLVLFIDDVQWADVATLDLLQYIARRWVEAGTRALLLLNIRAESMEASVGSGSGMLGQLLAGLMREAPSKQLMLDVLTEADILRLVRSLSGVAGESAQGGDQDQENEKSSLEIFGKQLFSETGGQPFFIIETLKALQERGLLEVRQQGETEWVVELAPDANSYILQGFVAPGVREMVKGRLAQLARGAEALLAAGAVLGHDFDFDVLCSVSGLSENEALQGLEQLLQLQILKEIQANRGLSADIRYLFAHDKIREVVYAEAGASRRQVFHRRALNSLMAHNAPAAELAHHALASGHLPLAFHLSLAAGDTALRLFAVQDAITHYERARHLVLDQRSAGESALHFSVADLKSLYSQLGRAYELTNEWGKVRSAYEEMLLLSRELSELALESAALNRLASLSVTLGVQENPDLEPALLLSEALRVANQSGDKAGAAETEWALAQMNFVQRDAEAALSHGKRAIELSRVLGLNELEARSLNVMAYACTDLILWDRALDYGEQARSAYAKLGNKALEADSLCVEANSCIHLGRPQVALDLARRAQLISGQIENSWGVVSSGLFVTLGLIEIDECPAALEIAQRGLELARETVQSPSMVIFALARLGGVYRGLGRLPEAIEAHREAFTLSEQPGLRWWFAEMAAAELCADYCASGDWTVAYPYARRALSGRGGTLPFVVLLFPSLVEALVRNGYWESASTHVQHLSDQAGNNVRMKVSELRARAVLAQAMDEPDKAAEALQRAATLASHERLLGELHLIEAQS